MGFLESGTPLNWTDSLPYVSKVKRDGLKQLFHVWQLNRNREDTELKWGDEVEYQLVHLDHDAKEAKLCTHAPSILEALCEREKSDNWPDPQTLGQAAMLVSGASSSHLRRSEWHPEFGSHMIEATPNPPYDLSVNSLLDVEDSLISRRYKLQSILPRNVFALSLPAFPHLGVENFTWTEDENTKSSLSESSLSAASKFIPQSLICPHPRFGTLVANINSRRGVKVIQLIPVFKDLHTMEKPIWSNSLPSSSCDRVAIATRAHQTTNPVKGHIFMDHFAFGMGLCCLQVTFGCPNLLFARHLYDQMSVLAPIFLALSAGTPALRGLLAATDTRWKVLEQGCDCRTKEELEKFQWSRYGAVPMYIGTGDYLAYHMQELNDIPVPIDQKAFNFLKGVKMDENLATHFSHLWVRDPLVIFSDRIDLDNSLHVDHFENIQSTNWYSVRFKPPPVSLDGKTRPKIGWRVELRTPDLQISDFANAALSCFAQLLCLAILRENWQFYIPISQSVANMEVAHKRDAVIKELFYFRNDVLIGDDPFSIQNASPSRSVSRMTLREVFLGSRRTKFLGLIPMLDKFVSNEWRNQRCSRNAVEKYRIYANYIRQKVLGQAWSDAKLLRHLVRSSPLYEGDSVISKEMNYEVCKFVVMAGFGLCQEVSPWKFPGCLPSGRISKPCSLAALASKSSVLSSIAQIPIEGNKTVADKLLDISSESPMMCTENEEAQHSGVMSITCRECWDPVAVATVAPTMMENIRPAQVRCISQSLGPNEPTLQDFDPALFLEMDKHSR